MRALRQDSQDSNGNPTTYTYAPPITTCGKMSYLYGYLEIRAKVPHGKGMWPAFWLKCSNDQYEHSKGDVKLGYEQNLPFYGEVDVFEVFGDDTLIPNLHKWSTGGHDQATDHLDKVTVNKKNIADFGTNDWHTYGFEWTPDKMSMYIDGQVYQTFDLNVNFDGTTTGVDKSGFNSPLSIVLSMGLITNELTKSEDNTWLVGRELVDSDYSLGDTIAEFAVDYIRLYQKSDGKLWTRY